MINAVQTRKIIILSAALLAISGCVSSDMSDLQQEVDQILARPGGRIEPLPEIKPYEAYTYQAGEKGLRSPFQLFYEKPETEVAENDDAGLTKEMEKELKYRNREELETYELDSLRMVGTLEDQTTQWAIIRDPNGIVHRVKVGNYMGKNIGKILNIFEDRIELREIVKNSNGRWVERQAAIALAE
ncbi:MAG TPA: pilus assembly protein PilP [Gammaproteobacteria bacterium]|nr:pilus assembly protein PilP [Gammaproteobacteria bacterium]